MQQKEITQIDYNLFVCRWAESSWIQPAFVPGEFVIFTHSVSIHWILNQGKESYLLCFVPKTKRMTYLKGLP